MNPLPSINQMFSLLIQQERQFNSPVEEDTFVAQMSKPFNQGKHWDINTKSSSVARGCGIKIFPYCQKLGHTIDVCFKTHGLPPYLKKENMAQTTDSEDNTMEKHQQQGDITPEGMSIGFTREQLQALLALFQ